MLYSGPYYESITMNISDKPSPQKFHLWNISYPYMIFICMAHASQKIYIIVHFYIQRNE